MLFGSCGGAVTSVRAAEGDERVRAVVGYALPVVLTGGRGAALAGLGGATRALAMARLGLGEAVLRGSRGRLLPGRLAPWLNVPLIRALRAPAGERPTLLLFGGEDDVQDQLARYGLDRLRGVEIDELAGIGHHFDDPEDVERVAAAMDAWLGVDRSAVDVDPVRFLDDVAAVDDERLSGDVAGLLAGQERDRRGDLARAARPADRRRSPGRELLLGR